MMFYPLQSPQAEWPVKTPSKKKKILTNTNTDFFHKLSNRIDYIWLLVFYNQEKNLRPDNWTTTEKVFRINRTIYRIK